MPEEEPEGEPEGDPMEYPKGAGHLPERRPKRYPKGGPWSTLGVLDNCREGAPRGAPEEPQG